MSNVARNFAQIGNMIVNLDAIEYFREETHKDTAETTHKVTIIQFKAGGYTTIEGDLASIKSILEAKAL